MKRESILVCFCLASVTLAIPRPLQNPAYIGYQDSLGQYSFGYSAPESARSEVRQSNGQTRGSYSYVDGDGIIQSAKYTADEEHGFQIAATNLPQAVEDTPEVVAAREAHLEALRLAYEREQEELILLGQQQFRPQQLGQQQLIQPNLSPQEVGQDLCQQGIDQQIFGEQKLKQQEMGQQQFSQQDLGQQQIRQLISQQQKWSQELDHRDGNVVAETKIRKEESGKQKIGAPIDRNVGQVYSGGPEALQSPEVDAARKSYIEQISAERAKVEGKQVRNLVRDIITKVSQTIGPVVKATVTDESGTVVQHVGQKGSDEEEQKLSESLLQHQGPLKRSGITPASATLLMKNQTFSSEGFMEQINLKDKQSSPDAGSQLFQHAVPNHISKPILVPSTIIPIKYSSDAETPSQPTFAVQCFVTRADQFGSLVDVN